MSRYILTRDKKINQIINAHSKTKTYLPIPKLTEEQLKKFCDKIKVYENQTCWIWKGQLNGGYGIFEVNRLRLRAHRVAYFQIFGEIPDELDHECEVRFCVNPWHLTPCTHLENIENGKERRKKIKRT